MAWRQLFFYAASPMPVMRCGTTGAFLDGSENALKTMVEYKPNEAEGLLIIQSAYGYESGCMWMGRYGSYRNRLSNRSGRGQF